MGDPERSGTDDWLPAAARPRGPVGTPLSAFRAALGRYEGIRLVELHRAQGLPDLGVKPQALAGVITDRLAEPKVIERLIAGLATGSRLAASLFSVTESTSWPLAGLTHALACLGVDPVPAIRGLSDVGLLAVWLGTDGGPVYDIAKILDGETGGRVELLAHPSLLTAMRTTLPEAEQLTPSGPVSSIREADGLEPVIRLAAIWQRVLEEPLRQTQQDTLYKRDRERIGDDRVLAGPIADSLEPLPDMAGLWLALARGVGLLIPEDEGDRVLAAPSGYWAENAIHLQHMIAAKWLALRTWHEQGGIQQEGSTAELAWPFVRPVVLLWLATVPPEAWVRVDDLAGLLQSCSASWDLPSFLPAPLPVPAMRGKPRKGRADGRASAIPGGTGVLDATLLGAAYQLGLVRAAEEVESRRRVVQLTPLGRYVLALGPPPPPRPQFEHFLFVQPNFEIIAYRQGLNPGLIGQFSRFARWIQAGAALELRLTPESVYQGLEGGLAPKDMLERLAAHSPRALPPGVAEAVRTWAERRERVTYHASATLIEFASAADLEKALRDWPDTGLTPPVAVSERLLLIEEESAIPYQRFRTTGSRDYRRPGESCVEVEENGVTLTLDLARSDLMVDAELARFTEELAPTSPTRATENPRRRFRVTRESIGRAAEGGLTAATLAQWFLARTGAPIPPAVRMMLLAGSSRVPALQTDRPLVLHTPSAEILDGLLQHPDTKKFFGDRLGPTAIIVPDEAAELLEHALTGLGLSIEAVTGTPPTGNPRQSRPFKSTGRGT